MGGSLAVWAWMTGSSVTGLQVGAAPSPTGGQEEVAASEAGPSVLAAMAEETFPADTWATATPAEAKLDADLLDVLVRDIDEGVYGHIDHLLVIRHGHLVLDRAFPRDFEAVAAPHEPKDHPYDYDHPSWHPYYQGTSLHTMQSVTKSVMSAAFGIARDQGHLPDDLSTRAMPYFASYEPDLSDPRRAAITLEDLLTMRGGIAWDEITQPLDESNSCVGLEASEDWMRFVLSQPMRSDPGTTWNYSSGESVLLGKVVREATGVRMDEFAQTHLFDPIGIREAHWKLTPCGEVDTEGGLYLSAHDLARFAYLFLREGRWGETRVISEEWVRRSTSPVVPDIAPDDGVPSFGYGYQWWVLNAEDGQSLIYAGRGYGGQLPIVVPEDDLIVVFTAWNIHGQAETSPMQAMSQHILPAVLDGNR